ncbi:TM0106 family RecB-like putative nuclease [Corynebacterium sp. SCR221107]|uniref:TM0106 family RecB-like putative nuclease n=1 Tax=Corynebacterium sp. SCR221107 TaxID=3017361 RepID=UPI0022EC8B88|nr:TM0106 family RecB-like putative nuclease [Corynebacterium sp. SCR221107]WBT08645.1 TM0106 family RecB-like putative nuclease [Corynebacterium sp. SCR221107]
METDQLLSPSDLVGCRYRQVQKRRYPGLELTAAAINRRRRLESARELVASLFPSHPQLGDNRHFFRIDLLAVDETDPDDIDRAWLETLEALAAGAHFIHNAVLQGRSAIMIDAGSGTLSDDHGGRTQLGSTTAGLEASESNLSDVRWVNWYVRVDALVRRKNGTYYPVLVTNHRVARPDSTRRVKVVGTSRLGLGNSGWANFRLKSHAIDSYSLALAARSLDSLGLGCQRGGLIGQDRQLTFLLDTDMLQQGLDRALAVPTQHEARRIKECAGCRFWQVCEPELVERDDISLYLPGDRAAAFRAKGIDTVEGLVEADLGEASRLADAWRKGILFLKKSPSIVIPRFDVEIDLDVEAYLDQGAYLWGTFDGETYRPFVTFDGIDQEGVSGEGENFARMWKWLSESRQQAAAEGKSFGVYCYSAHGENHWLRSSAQRFYRRIEGAPSPEEIQEFINSGHWVDVFALVKKNVIGTAGLGLKQVGPAAGFHWMSEEIDGEESITLYREAIGLDTTADVATARRLLLGYNADDCKATRAVREWLDQQAPGAPLLKTDRDG